MNQGGAWRESMEEAQRACERLPQVNNRRDAAAAFYQQAERSNRKGMDLMEGERELTTGMLSKGASFRLIVSGSIGEKEIER